MNDLLASSWTKFHRARQHYKALDAALVRSFDPDTHPVTLKVETEVTGDTAVALVRVEPCPRCPE